jgi:hypothetical protein
MIRLTGSTRTFLRPVLGCTARRGLPAPTLLQKDIVAGRLSWANTEIKRTSGSGFFASASHRRTLLADDAVAHVIYPAKVAAGGRCGAS